MMFTTNRESVRRKATIDELITYARPIAVNHGIDAILNWSPMVSDCACMGPRDGYPLCPCHMRYELAEHKDEIATRLIAEYNKRK